jgi:hypothetical protein
VISAVISPLRAAPRQARRWGADHQPWGANFLVELATIKFIIKIIQGKTFPIL